MDIERRLSRRPDPGPSPVLLRQLPYGREFTLIRPGIDARDIVRFRIIGHPSEDGIACLAMNPIRSAGSKAIKLDGDRPVYPA